MPHIEQAWNQAVTFALWFFLATSLDSYWPAVNQPPYNLSRSLSSRDHSPFVTLRVLFKVPRLQREIKTSVIAYRLCP